MSVSSKRLRASFLLLPFQLLVTTATAQDSKEARRYPRILGSVSLEGVPRG